MFSGGTAITWTASTECSADPTGEQFIALFSLLDNWFVFHLGGIANSRKEGAMDEKVYQVSPLQFALGQLDSFLTLSSAEKSLVYASSVTPFIVNKKESIGSQ